MARTTKILGVNVNDMTRAELLSKLQELAGSGMGARVFYYNIYGANLAYELPWFRTFLNTCDVVFCDGFGVVLGARLVGQGTLARHSPPDFIDEVFALAASRALHLYFLGGRPSVAELAAGETRSRFGPLEIGTHHGYFDRNAGSDENNALVSQIKGLATDVLLVGLGMPLQEAWTRENQSALGVKLIIAVGAYLEYAAGTLRRPPRWMTDHGLEWFGRLFIEPGRLWRRYLLGIPLFYLRLIGHHWLRLRLPGE